MYASIGALLFVLGTLAALLVVSPGSLRPVVDSAGRPLAGGLAEKAQVDINGTRQGMIIRSANPENPVLLIVHGGPGMPEYFLDEQMPTGLEQDFTVVWWDQRGAGLSYAAGATSMTVDTLVDDTIAVADYLRERFGKPKVYLLAHSWGSYIGVLAAERAPDRFHAYIGMGQITHQIESEKLAYDYALQKYRERGDIEMVDALLQSPVETDSPLPAAWNAARDNVMHRLGVGTTQQMDSVVTGVFVPSWTSREYTLNEKVDLWRGKVRSRRIFWDPFMKVDLRKTVRTLAIPVYFIQGRYDYTTSYPLARDYFSQISAPAKGFYTFEDSAHSPMFEQPTEFRRILRDDVLTGTTDLADVDQETM